MSVLRVHATCTSLDPASLESGRDLVLEISEAFAILAPPGVYVGDELAAKDKLEIDHVAGSVLAEWRRAVDGQLTVDGFCLPFAWEREVLASAVLPTLRAIRGVAAALDRWSPTVLELDSDLNLADTLTAAAQRAAPHVKVRRLDGRPAVLLGQIPRGRKTLGTRILGAVDHFGIPSRVRPGAVVVVGYWSMAAASDELLASPTHLPAAMLTMRLPGVGRTVRAMRQGGWIGVPGRRAVERAGQDVAAALGSLGPVPPISAFGIDVGAAVHAAAREVAMQRGAADLAIARMMRSALKGSCVSAVLLPFDSTPGTRLLVEAARETGVPTIVLAHSGYWFPAIVHDMEVADEVAVWSARAVDRIDAKGRRMHVTGYPNGRAPAPVRTRRMPLRAPRIVVLDQPAFPLSTLVDARMAGMHYETAVRAVSRVAPDAVVVLRPHPSRSTTTSETIRSRFPTVTIELASKGPILDVFRDADLCIGSASTATLEAAYAGVPVVVLDLTGVAWPWPLGGDTDVPIARNEEELAGAVRELLGSGRFPGRHSLLSAIGALPEMDVARHVEFVPGVPGRLPGGHGGSPGA